MCSLEQTAVVAIDAMEPDVRQKVEYHVPLSLLLLRVELWTFGSDVTDDAAVMTGGQASFVGMLLDFLFRNMVSILTNNITLTFYMSPMRRDIF
jgi:hypothetical protein